MIRFVLFALLLFVSGAMFAQNRDTSFIRRPYYIGFTAGYSLYGPNAHDGTFFDVKNPPTVNQLYEEFYNERSIGIELAFPFLTKWECENSVEYSRTQGRTTAAWHHVVPLTDPEIAWTTAYSRQTLLQAVRLRSFFSYDLYNAGKFNLKAGAGGWFSSSPKVGVEAGLKCYYQITDDLALQLGTTAGYAKILGVYGGARISLLLTGTRTYRAHPYKYYVRTYEEGE